MKKIFSICMILVLTLCLVACNNSEQNNQNSEIKQTTYFPADEMNVYSMFQFIRLEENPTTGYTWQYKVEDETIAVVEDDEYTQNKTEEGMVGVGGEHTYRLTGISEGQTTITFKYMRPWEENAIKEVTFTLAVNENIEIAVIDEK